MGTWSVNVGLAGGDMDGNGVGTGTVGHGPSGPG
jgi:hypothetical protein